MGPEITHRIQIEKASSIQNTAQMTNFSKAIKYEGFWNYIIAYIKHIRAHIFERHFLSLSEQTWIRVLKWKASKQRRKFCVPMNLSHRLNRNIRNSNLLHQFKRIWNNFSLPQFYVGTFLFWRNSCSEDWKPLHIIWFDSMTNKKLLLKHLIFFSLQLCIEYNLMWLLQMLRSMLLVIIKDKNSLISHKNGD